MYFYGRNNLKKDNFATRKLNIQLKGKVLEWLKRHAWKACKR